MKAFLFILLLTRVQAEVSRSPAVVAESCDLQIETSKMKLDSQIRFSDETNHLVQVLPAEEGECEKLPQKKYPQQVYEDQARNEVDVLLRKYPDVYNRKCEAHFQALGLKKSQYKCLDPVIESISFIRHTCEKRLATAVVKIALKQTGLLMEDKPLEQILKEQCSRVKECIAVADEKERPELTKLSEVACKHELTAPQSGRAPAVVNDTSFDGKREPKESSHKRETVKVDQNDQKTLGK